MLDFNEAMKFNMLSLSEHFPRYRSPLKKEKKMEIPFTRNFSYQQWLAILISLITIFTLLCFGYATFFDDPSFLLAKQENQVVIMSKKTSLSNKNPDSDSCTNRYIYIHDLPSRFNYDFIKNCEDLVEGSDRLHNMCPYLENFGFGPEVENSEEGLSNYSSWYDTNPYSLEVIFHNRMKRYECLTNDSSLASAIFVPFYAGFDISRFMYGNHSETLKDSLGKDLLQWLARKREWKKMWGRDHFLVSGRIAWSYRRKFDNVSLWGSKFRFLPESMNMTMLATESASWNNDIAIPYTTSFHPSEDTEILQWQHEIRWRKRPHLFTFSGAPRPGIKDSMRGKIISHCQGSKFCKFIDCSQGDNCYNTINLMKVFQRSVFCLQPQGDSHTRKSTFDSMLAGCIPVFFHPGSAYSQYLWHLPKNRSKYSVYVPVRDVNKWNPNMEKILLGFPEHEVLAMREEIIKLIPRIIYRDPRSKLKIFEDTFDVAVNGMLQRIERVRKVIKKRKDPSVGFADEDPYKFTIF
ncbi:hypothetical protein L6164_012146 [Bauhinia variegata]|uniref:Uncharacterized protein n=1 Tax=Bauhinia variegata TaxID=167791 RepID=A0ACB9P9D3_BAUVA|nr:hypothetical protein L6164_012146 [Bauhinia variegata]